MAKINNTTNYPNTPPALTDHVIGTDVSDTGNSADGETVTFKLDDILKLGGFRGVQLFTSSGTWTKPAGCNAVFVFITGAGAGGTDDADGKEGGTAIGYIDVSSISSATITVGAGGTGRSSGTSIPGGDSIWTDGTNTLTGQGGKTNQNGNYSGSDIGTKYSFFGDPYGYGGDDGNGGTGEDGGDGVVYILQFS